MLIEVQGLGKSYRMGTSEVHALRDVSLQVARGEFLAIMGVSGSGKSTLLHLLGGLDRPSTGRYHLDGRALEALSDTELSRVRNRQIGFVFQNFNLIPQHSVLENVELPLIYAGQGKAHRRQRCLQLLEQIGLSEKAAHRPAELSGGEVQRVAVARALAAAPALLLADEPTGNLDSATGAEVMRLFARLNDGGTTILVVTHSREVASYAKRLIEMLDGRIISDTRPAP